METAIWSLGFSVTLRVQVPNNHILFQSMFYNCYCPNPSTQLLGTWTLWDKERDSAEVKGNLDRSGEGPYQDQLGHQSV